MKIILKNISLLNFKGVRKFETSFNEKENDIYGDNRTGKTTVFDAFLWLLFDKNSSDAKDFSIKTLDVNGEPFRRLEHEVSATIMVDKKTIVLRKVYAEKWQKPKGQLELVFTGHETTYYWNGVPLKKEDYQVKIADLLNEGIFKLITNTSYFNKLAWQDRRNVLMELAGEIPNSEILGQMSNVSYNLVPLTDALNQEKTLDEYKKELAVNKKKIKDDLLLIPSRIDEANRSLPEPLPYDELEIALKSSLEAYSGLETQLTDKTTAQKTRQTEMVAKLKEIQSLTAQCNEIEFNEKNKVQDARRAREQEILNLKRDLKNKLDDVTRNAIDMSDNTTRRNHLENQRQGLRDKWHTVNNEKLEFSADIFACPTCKRAFEETDLQTKQEELTRNFNSHKSTRLAEIQAQGMEFSATIKLLDEVLTDVKNKDTILKGDASAINLQIVTAERKNIELQTNETLQVQQSLANNPTHRTIREKITSLQSEVDTPTPPDKLQKELTDKRNVLAAQIDSLKKQIATRELSLTVTARIAELSKQETTLAQQLADLEAVEFSILQFLKLKMELIVQRINTRFKIVTFKMFNKQVDGQLVPCCDTLIDGVPYCDANNAAKIQGGLDIINVLSTHYNVFAPVFIDNRESVVIIPETHSQIINLIVSAEDKKLRVSQGKPTLQSATI